MAIGTVKSFDEQSALLAASHCMRGVTVEGTMLWFNPAKRHGFIRTDDGERLRVDLDGFATGEPPEDRCRGTRVSFERTDGQAEEARAVNVAVVPAVIGRRARLRGNR